MTRLNSGRTDMRRALRCSTAALFLLPVAAYAQDASPAPAEAANAAVAQDQAVQDQATQSVPAETARSGQVFEDIVVTARAREESLYDAPLSITSLGEEAIADANLRDITDLAQVSPGFYYTPQVTFSSSRVIPAMRFRGLTIPRSDPLEQLAGVFVDGVYLFGGVQSLTFDDVQRVEVIKGPQSALFGRGTFSGAINFITREPSDVLSARVSAGFETRDSRSLTASMEGPLLDGLTFRISGASNRKGAHFTATDGGELGREDTDVINAQLVWKPVSGLRLRLRHSEVWLDDSRNATANLNPNYPTLLDAPGRCQVGTAPFYCGALPTVDDIPAAAASAATSLIPPAFALSDNPNIILDILNNNLDNPLIVNGLPYIEDTPHLDHAGLRGRFHRTSIETDYDLANGMSAHIVLSKSRMAATTAQSSTDDNGNAYVVSTNILTDKSIDFRLNSASGGRFSWLIGGNYFQQKSVGGLSGTGGIVSVLDATNMVSYREPAIYTGQGKVEYYSAFFGLHYDVFDMLALDVEGRYQVDKATMALDLPSQETSTYRKFLPRVIATFKPSEDLTIYGSWARGATRGTTNAETALLSPELRAEVEAIPGYKFAVPVETIDSFELGVKQVLGHVRYSLAAYYMNWRNLKNQVNTPCPGNLCGPDLPGAFAHTIIGETADIYGFEGEVEARVTSNFDASLNMAYTHARYDNLFNPLTLAPTGQTDASGKTPVGFPKLQGSFAATYHRDIDIFDGDWQTYLRGEANYTGRIYADEINQSWINDKVLVNLRAGIETSGVRLEAYVQNLFNNKDWVSAVRGSSSNYRVGPRQVSQPTVFAVLPRLRTFGLRASYAF